MFGFGKARREATEIGAAAARMAIMPFWGWDRKFDDRIWSDPYVLGLIDGSISAQTLPVTGRKLSATDKGFVLLNAKRDLGAPQSALDLSLKLADTNHPEYARGFDNGILTFVIMAGLLKAEAYSEPDIVAAKEAIPTFRKVNAFMSGPTPPDPNQELASAYIFLQVQEHKRAHYDSEG